MPLITDQQPAEQIKQLLCELETLVNSNDADAATLQLEALNSCLKSWCESAEQPSSDELTATLAHINTILTQANNHKDDSFKALLKHKKSDKAISAYKST
jgi:ABC-type transporter Mla subunit MlaD